MQKLRSKPVFFPVAVVDIADAVLVIANDGMPPGSHVRADLMCFPCDEPDLEQRNVISGTDRAVFGLNGHGAFRCDPGESYGIGAAIFCQESADARAFFQDA